MANPPGITQLLPLPYGHFREFLSDPLGFQLRARERFGDVFRFRIGPLLIHFVYHPEHVRHVLYDHQKNYLRGWQYRVLRKLVGDNLVISEGDYWRRQRRLAQPAFHRQRFTRYAEVMADATSAMLTRWEDAAASQRPIDVVPEMSRLALAIASRTLFDRDMSHEADAVGRAFAIVGRYLEDRWNRPFTTPPAWLPTPSTMRFRRAIRQLNQIVLALVRERRREARDHGDLLSMLMQARDDDTGEAMTDDQLCSEALAFLLAGQETTATALSWTSYLLASQPSVQQRVCGEIDAIVGDRPSTAADLPNLPTVQMVLEEAMRLFPPIWAVARQAVQDDEMGGFVIPAGSTVVISPYVTHRHPGVWKDADTFNPDRFQPEQVAARPKGAYFPFLGGPHQCIGAEFAMLEMRLVLALVVQKFDISPASEHPISPYASVTLRPDGPVRVVLRRREIGKRG